MSEKYKLCSATDADIDRLRTAYASNPTAENRQAIADAYWPRAATPAQPIVDVSAPTVHSRLMEMSEITRRNVRWTGNEHQFGVISATDAAMLDDLLGDALSLLNAASARAAAPMSGQGATLPPLPEPDRYAQWTGGSVMAYPPEAMTAYGQLCIDSRPRSEDSRAKVLELFQHEDCPLVGLDGDKPFCRFGWYEDGGVAGIGESARGYWALAMDQAGTELAELTAQTDEAATSKADFEAYFGDSLDYSLASQYRGVVEGEDGYYDPTTCKAWYAWQESARRALASTTPQKADDE